MRHHASVVILALSGLAACAGAETVADRDIAAFRQAAESFEQLYAGGGENCARILATVAGEVRLVENGEDWGFAELQEFCPHLPAKRVVDAWSDRTLLDSGLGYDFTTRVYENETGAPRRETTVRVWRQTEAGWKIIRMSSVLSRVEADTTTPVDADSLASAFAPVTSARSVLDTLPLESARIGRVEYLSTVDDRARARALATLVDDAAAVFERELGLRFDVSIAALGPDDWFSEFPGIPYAVPWPDMRERVLVLPSSLTEDVLIMGPTEVADRRRVDFVALHEYGHVAAKEYFRPDAPEPYLPVKWFEELVATYVAWAYVAQADAAWAAAARAEWDAQIRDFTPPVLSLDWRFMNDLPGPELSRVYAWYQFLLNEQAAALYDRHGLALLPRLGERLPWTHASTWTDQTLLHDLRTVAPELARWAESFGSDGTGASPGPEMTR